MSSTHTEELILLKNICKNPTVDALIQAVDHQDIAMYTDAYASLLTVDSECSFAEFLCREILFDDNLFARQAHAGNLRSSVSFAFAHDLMILQNLAKFITGNGSNFFTESGLPAIGYGKDNPLFESNWSDSKSIEKISEFFHKNGYGMFIGHKAFTYSSGTLKPVLNPSDITLSDLKNYESEKQAVLDNVENFVRELPFSDMLLYGDKGTGKSSTVHAVLNFYAETGLRAVEIQKEQLGVINELKETLASLPFKFIIFIDDLSLEERDEKIYSLKASLEGSINAMSSNVMIVATSNRRNILKENFSDRENSVHARDTMEEQLSLSDRFGIKVLFSSTGKQEYLSIIKQLAEDKKMDISEDTLFALAERWAIQKGGRSPRRAKQFIDYAFSCLSKGIQIDF